MLWAVLVNSGQTENPLEFERSDSPQGLSMWVTLVRAWKLLVSVACLLTHLMFPLNRFI